MRTNIGNTQPGETRIPADPCDSPHTQRIGAAMAIYHPTSITCSCGATFPAHVARTLNVRRFPDLRERVLDLQLHRVVCPRCKRQLTVERPLSYVDPDRNAVFLVQPR